MSHFVSRQGVFGVGSNHGADALGWEAIDYLRSRLAERETCAGVRWMVSRTPMDMVARWEELEGVVLIDALVVSGPGQAVRQVAPEELAARQATSTHGLGIHEAIALAKAVNITPRISVVALPVRPETFTGAGAYFSRQGEALTRLVSSLLQCD